MTFSFCNTSPLFTPLFNPNPNPLQVCFPHKPSAPWKALHRNRRLYTDVRVQAKAKPLILGRPSVQMEDGKYSYEVQSIINTLSSLPPRGSIARCLETFKNKLSLNDFALVFKEFAQRGDWQRSLRLFKYTQRKMWCKPNEHIYTIIISLLGREKLLDKCQEIFDDMATHGVARSVFSYTALINAYGRNGKYETSLELLDRMKQENISPSILTYNTVIHACARGGLDWEGLLGLFAEMRHDAIQPDLVTYNTLLSACANRGLGDGAEMVFRTMNEAGVLPDITSYNYLVQTFEKLNKLEKVSELFEKMESGGNVPEASSYNVLIEAFARSRSLKEAMGVLRQMQAAGCLPNAATYSILLSLYGKNGRFDDVRELFLEMKVSNTEPDADTYNILLQVFGEGGYFKEVVTLFHDMVDENVEPTMETYEGLAFACGKGGLHDDANKILVHMNGKRIVPSSKVFTGVIEAYGKAALYEEAIVIFNTMHEMGSLPTVETYNSLIHSFARGGLYQECEAILSRMGAAGITKNKDTFNALIEVYRQAGRFEESIRAYVNMDKAKCVSDELTFETVLSVYCFAGLVDESLEQFQEIKATGILPSVICYCMLLAVYAKSSRQLLQAALSLVKLPVHVVLHQLHPFSFNGQATMFEISLTDELWDDVDDLLAEMCTNKVSSIHLIVGQMIKGEYDDGTNWQMVEYIFDKLNSEGSGLGMRFYNALLEALWWLEQRERAVRVLKEAVKRGLFPELFRKSKLVWSVDVHRMWEGSACTAISLWLNDMHEMFINGEDIPHLAAVVVVRGQMERSTITREFPIYKAAYSLLNKVSSSFCCAGWNKGRIVCQKIPLKRILSGKEPSSERPETDPVINLTNSSFPLSRSRNSNLDVKSSPDDDKADLKPMISSMTELMASGV